MTLRVEPGVGDLLSNGAVVLDRKGSEALCVWAKSRDCFVIWTIDETTGEPYRGRYFSSLGAALRVWQ